MKRTFRASLVLSIIASVFSPIYAEAVSTDCTIDSSTYCKATFAFSGATETFVVPSGTTSIIVEIAGAQGGSGLSAGGNGGFVKGTLSVTPGSSIYVYVGGQNG
jgi:hypothetical protein